MKTGESLNEEITLKIAVHNYAGKNAGPSSLQRSWQGKSLESVSAM